MATPELDLAEEEAKKFAGSLAKISSLYDDKFNPRVVAWVDLICVAGAIYGPRIILIKTRWDREDAARKAATPTYQNNPVPINAQRPKQPATPQPPPTGTPARSPVDLFGAEFFGANIPDAV
jgi:hypothetical protein